MEFLVTVYMEKKCFPWYLLNKQKKFVSLSEFSETLGMGYTNNFYI